MLNCANPGGPDPMSRLQTVLILEDEGLVSLMMEDQVRELGAMRVFTCRGGHEALNVVREQPLDCAILDVSLRGDASYDVADELAARDIPFLFCTGLTVDDLVERHRSRPLLTKPYSDADFRAVLARALAG
jgi:CheY-like chemotaxis protein